MPDDPNPFPKVRTELASEQTRAWAYRVGLAVIALLAVYGKVTAHEAAAWGALLLAFLGVGSAAYHTSTKP